MFYGLDFELHHVHDEHDEGGWLAWWCTVVLGFFSKGGLSFWWWWRVREKGKVQRVRESEREGKKKEKHRGASLI